jgi:pteridine reductase
VDLKGKAAIVTGGAVRVGRGLSLALAASGARVLVHYSGSDTQARSTVEEIRSHGGEADCVAADFGNPDAAAPAVLEAAINAFGRADILINSAAIFEPGTLASTTEVAWDRHFAINLKAPFFLSREFAARRVQDQAACIVNVVDWRGLRPKPGHLAYTLTKSALVTLTQILAQELAPAIRVNAVAPGAILPPAGAGPDYLRRLAEQIPLHRSGSVSDVTSAVLFLLQSDFVTGEILFVTGGEHLP